MSAQSQERAHSEEGLDIGDEEDLGSREDKRLPENETAQDVNIGLTPTVGDNQEKGKRERKEPINVSREPGKSLFPFSRVQKIIKVDRVSQPFLILWPP
jgi:hypothetical protein